MLCFIQGRIYSMERRSRFAITLSQKWCQQYLSQGYIFFYFIFVYKSSRLMPQTTINSSTIGFFFYKSNTILKISLSLLMLVEFYLSYTTYSGVRQLLNSYYSRKMQLVKVSRVMSTLGACLQLKDRLADSSSALKDSNFPKQQLLNQNFRLA